MFQNQGALLQNLLSRNTTAVVKKENKTANTWFLQEAASVQFSDEAKKMLDNLEKQGKTVEAVSKAPFSETLKNSDQNS